MYTRVNIVLAGKYELKRQFNVYTCQHSICLKRGYVHTNTCSCTIHYKRGTENINFYFARVKALFVEKEEEKCKFYYIFRFYPLYSMSLHWMHVLLFVREGSSVNLGCFL